ncbi:MAG: GerMN domain-containing protein, partial [Bacillota bacterium]|nr:GerMN domain-containing protein [Bacillota bacterium]
NEYASFTVTIDYTTDNKIQQRINNGGTETLSVLKLEGGKLSEVYRRSEAYYRENLTDKENEKAEILLMEPLEKGTTWTLSDGSRRTITDIEAPVETPSGNYKAIKVETENQNGKTADYYAKNIGLVKTVFSSGATEVSSSLKKIEENVSLTQNISFFYPNIKNGKIYIKDQKVSFKTNDKASDVLGAAYKQVINSDLHIAIPESAKINNIYLDEKNIVHVDFYSSAVKDLNTGSGTESMILQSISDTFGKYYNTDKVIVTINGKPYESGHISMKEGEYLKADPEKAIQIP